MEASSAVKDLQLCYFGLQIQTLYSFYALPLVIQTTPGFVPFFEQKIQGIFKDFQGHISHFSRTPFSAKKSLESLFFFWFFHNMSNFIPKVFLCLLFFLWSSTYSFRLALKFKDFPSPTTIFKDFQGLELLF